MPPPCTHRTRTCRIAWVGTLIYLLPTMTQAFPGGTLSYQQQYNKPKSLTVRRMARLPLPTPSQYQYTVPQSLTRYSDDGFTLSAPTRYSVSDWAENILNIGSSMVLRRIQSHLLFNFFWACGLTALCYAPFPEMNDILPNPQIFDHLNLYLPFAMSSGILGILLAFRTSQSYQRFWSGRQIWAEIISTERSIARCLQYVDNLDDEYVDSINRWLITFPIALMQHLRGERSLSDFKALNDQDLRLIEGSDNMPICCLMVLTKLLNKIKLSKNQSAHELLWWQMESYLTMLTDAIGSSEAIAGCPVPLSYSRHTSRLLSLWTIMSPFVLIQCLPPIFVPFVTLLLSWTLLATEEIGHIIEEPFGIHDDRPNILNLQRYCEVIENDIQLMSAENLKLDEYDKPPSSS